jgi:endonuclease/exonuclease/phosphatase family metal-dependent hydrolase
LRSRRFTTLVLLTLFAGMVPGAWFYSTQQSVAEPIVRSLGGGPQITIMTLNLAKVTDVDAILRELRPADILLFQEVVRARESDASVAENIARRLGFDVEFAAPDGGSTASGIAILSRFKLTDVRVYPVPQVNLVFRTRKRILLAATVQTPGGPTRVICAHLDTRINPADRLKQLGPGIADAKSFDGPVLIAGDLNTNDMQWVSHVVPVPWPGWQAARVRDLMSENGFHTPFSNRRATFDHLGMQLDWIFLRKLAARRAEIVPMAFSDHHALVAVVTPAGQ